MWLRKGSIDRAREVAQALTKRHPQYLKGWNTLAASRLLQSASTSTAAQSAVDLAKSATAWVNMHSTLSAAGAHKGSRVLGEVLGDPSLGMHKGVKGD